MRCSNYNGTFYEESLEIWIKQLYYQLSRVKFSIRKNGIFYKNNDKENRILKLQRNFQIMNYLQNYKHLERLMIFKGVR